MSVHGVISSGVVWLCVGLGVACGGGQASHVRKPSSSTASAPPIVKAKVPDASPSVQQGETWLAQGKMSEAEGAFRQALVEQPSDARAYFDLGLVLEHKQQLEAAMHAYQKAIHVQPEFKEPKTNLALLYRDQGKLQEAEVLLKQVVDLDPTDGEAVLNLALTLEDEGNTDQAKEKYHSAITLLSNDPLPRVNLGLLLLNQGKTAQARTVLTDAMPLAKGDRALLTAIGNGLRRAGDGKGALRALEQAVASGASKAPDSLLAELALAQRAAGDRHAAIATLTQLVDTSPRYALGHYLLANFLAAEKRYQEAIPHYKRYLALEPRGPEASNAKKRLSVAQDAMKRHESK